MVYFVDAPATFTAFCQMLLVVFNVVYVST